MGAEAKTITVAAGATLSAEALRDDEHRRNRAYVAGELAAVTLVALGVGLVEAGDPDLRRALLLSTAGTIPGLALATWLLGRPSFNTPGWLMLFKTPLILSIALALRYFGLVSPFLIALTGGVVYYGQSSSRRLSAGIFITVMILIPAYLLAVSAGILEDRSLQHADARPLLEQAVTIAAIVCGMSLVRMYVLISRRSTASAMEALEGALRKVGQREAMLAEAHADLERALGARGRYSGQRAGPWVLGKVLGRGGMGEVYAASQPSTGAKAAVKLLLLDPDQDPALLTRFRREADALARLECPHVVKLLDVGALGPGQPYLVMELLEGTDLATRLRTEKLLDVPATLELVGHVARALEAARAAQIVHRDLKPQNVFFDSAARTWKVLDFGVSKLGSSGTLTAGNILGTPGYMAPEQAAGADVDHRADVFALTAIVFRCLTGRPAFTAEDPLARIAEVMQRQPPRPTSLATLEPDLDLVLALGLAKSPAERLDGAVQLAEALGEAARGMLNPILREQARMLIARHGWGQTALK